MIFDPKGVLYGTTQSGGDSNLGTVYSLTPHGGAWKLKALHSFTGMRPLSAIRGAALEHLG